jgi:hypothetical protein
MTRLVDHTGRRYGRLTADSLSGVVEGRTVWNFLCDCGNEVTMAVYRVVGGSTVSCGCFRNEQLGAVNRTHGLSKHPLYQIWKGMKARCYNEKNPSYHNYGGRGIKVCDRWRDSVEDFIEDLGERPSLSHTIDRIDNDGNYEPDNCKWSTKEEQSQNTRGVVGASSIYRGVSWDKSRKKWYGELTFKKGRYRLGSFKDELECHKAVEKKRNQLFKEEI